jgi:hypothetical protein
MEYNQYKIQYTYTSPRGVVITGKCLVQAKNEIHAKTITQWLTRDRNNIVITSIKRAKN